MSIMKFKFTVLFILLVGFSSLSFAQNKTKFGHINYGEIIRLIPGVDTAQVALEEFSNGFKMEGEKMSEEFKKLKEEYDKLASTPNISPARLKINEDELMKKYERIESFSAYMEEEIQKKQLELLKPFQNLLIDAIATVAKADNFTYIFDSSTLLHKNGEDIGPKVKIILGIKE